MQGFFSGSKSSSQDRRGKGNCAPGTPQGRGDTRGETCMSRTAVRSPGSAGRHLSPTLHGGCCCSLKVGSGRWDTLRPPGAEPATQM